MKNIAIVIGSSEYQNKDDNLPSVKKDYNLVSKILELSQKYEDILNILDGESSSEIKSKISTFIKKYKEQNINEIFFYFSGHGVRKTDKDRDELYLKLYNTMDDKILSTSLSNTEVDDYLRECNPDIAVKILDCCNSGTNYLKESTVPLFKRLEDAKSKFKDLVFISSSKENEASHALNDYSFFTKALALSILENKIDTDIYYKDLISSIADYSNSTFYPEPQAIIQGSILNPFINYNENVRNFLIEEEKLEPFKILETINNISKKEEIEGSFGLLHLQKIISDKSSNYLSKDEIFLYVKNLIDILINTESYKDINHFFEVGIDKDIYLPNEDSIGTWLKENKNKDYFAEPRYEQESYTTQEYVPAPQKIKKVINPSNIGSTFYGKSSILSRLGGVGYQEYEEVEQVLKSVTNYKSVLKGFNTTCTLTMSNNVKIDEKILLSLKPKSEFMCLRAYNIFLVIIFSLKEIAVFTKITTLKSYDWDRYKDIDESKWFVKENYLKPVSAEDCAQQVITSIRMKLEESIKDHISSFKDGD